MHTLDDAVGNSSFLAEMRYVDDQLDRIHIMSNNDQFGLILFNQSDTMIQSLLDENGFIAYFPILFALLGDRLCLLDKTRFLLLGCFRSILVQ